MKRVADEGTLEGSPKRAAREPANLSLLDDDIIVDRILAVLAFSGDIDAVVRFGATCRRFRVLASSASLWKSANFQKVLQSGACDFRKLARAPQVAMVETLDLSQPDDEYEDDEGGDDSSDDVSGRKGRLVPDWLPELIESMPLLRSLKLTESEPQIADRMEKRIFSPAERHLATTICGAPALRRLSFCSSIAATMFDGFRLPNLESLCLDSAVVKGDFFARHSEELSGLTDLALVDCPAPEWPSGVASVCKELRKLHVNFPGRSFSLRGADDLWRNCHRLEDVTLQVLNPIVGGPTADSLCLEQLPTAPCAASLRRLCLSGSGLGVEVCRIIGGSCFNLVDLKLGSWESVVSGGIAFLAPLLHLKYLFLTVDVEAYGARAFERDMTAVGEFPGCTSLTTLKLDGISDTSESRVDLRGLFQSRRCSNLKVVIASVQFIDPLDAADALATGCGQTLFAAILLRPSHNAMLPVLLARCPRLHGMEVWCDNFDPIVDAFSRPLNTRLARLSIRSQLVPGREVLMAIADGIGKNLELIELPNLRSIDPKVLAEFLARCPFLINLSS